MNEFILPPLPYAEDALAPVMSAETIAYHYGKHHRTYVTNLNKLIAGTPLEDKPMKYLLMKTEGAVFNNAAQVYNHNYFWKCLTPAGGGEPTGALAEAVNAKWGSFEAFREAFTKAALGQFGSGWAWLVHDPKENKLKVLSTVNEANPMQRLLFLTRLRCRGIAPASGV